MEHDVQRLQSLRIEPSVIHRPDMTSLAFLVVEGHVECGSILVLREASDQREARCDRIGVDKSKACRIHGAVLLVGLDEVAGGFERKVVLPVRLYVPDGRFGLGDLCGREPPVALGEHTVDRGKHDGGQNEGDGGQSVFHRMALVVVEVLSWVGLSESSTSSA